MPLGLRRGTVSAITERHGRLIRLEVDGIALHRVSAADRRGRGGGRRARERAGAAARARLGRVRRPLRQPDARARAAARGGRARDGAAVHARPSNSLLQGGVGRAARARVDGMPVVLCTAAQPGRAGLRRARRAFASRTSRSQAARCPSRSRTRFGCCGSAAWSRSRAPSRRASTVTPSSSPPRRRFAWATAQGYDAVVCSRRAGHRRNRLAPRPRCAGARRRRQRRRRARRPADPGSPPLGGRRPRAAPRRLAPRAGRARPDARRRHRARTRADGEGWEEACAEVCRSRTWAAARPRTQRSSAPPTRPERRAPHAALMEERRLGPVVGLGTWNTFRGDARLARDVAAAALDAGVRCFDTSPMYASEQALGAALAPRRDEATLLTKIWTPSPDEARQQLDDQLGLVRPDRGRAGPQPRRLGAAPALARGRAGRRTDREAWRHALLAVGVRRARAGAPHRALPDAPDPAATRTSARRAGAAAARGRARRRRDRDGAVRLRRAARRHRDRRSSRRCARSGSRPGRRRCSSGFSPTRASTSSSRRRRSRSVPSRTRRPASRPGSAPRSARWWNDWRVPSGIVSAAMRIGVAKEIKPQEYRVALTPAGARELVQRGHEVVVETGAGAGSQFPDERTRRPARGSRPSTTSGRAPSSCSR